LPARFAASPEFHRLLAGEPRPCLLRIALKIARDVYPELDPGPYLEAVDALAERVRQRCSPGARPRGGIQPPGEELKEAGGHEEGAHPASGNQASQSVAAPPAG
jgi:hypothetical protein